MATWDEIAQESGPEYVQAMYQTNLQLRDIATMIIGDFDPQKIGGFGDLAMSGWEFVIEEIIEATWEAMSKCQDSLMDAAAIQYAKGKGLAELSKQGVPAIEGSLDIFDRRAVEWLRDYQFELIQRITEDIRYGIKGSVMQGIFIGEDNQKIANRIRNYVTEPMPIYRKKDMLLVEQGAKTVDQIKPIRIISPEYRSMMISRTESIRVFNQANLSRYMESGVQKVEMSRHAGECKFCVEIRESGPWEISQSPYLPIHPHCRHSYLPIIDPKGLMRDLRDLGAQNYHDTIGEAPLQAGMDFLGNWAPKQIDAVKKNFNALPDHLRSSKFMDEGLIQMDPLQHFGSKIVDGRHVIVGEGWETERIVQELLNSYGRNWYGRYKKDLLQLGKKVDEIRFGEYFARYALHPNTIKDKDILQFFDEKVWRKNVPKKIPKKAVETPKPKPGKLTVEVPKFSAIGEVEEGAHDVLRVIDSEGNQWHVKALDSRRAKVEYEAWRLAKDLNLKTYDEVADIAVNQADQGLVQEMKKISKMIISPTDHLILTKNIGKKEDDLRLLMEAGEEHIIPVLQRNEEDVKKMFLFDLLTGNVDRNWGNAYYTKKGIYAIDHELVGGASVAGMVNHPAVALWDKQVIPRSFDDFWAAEFTDLVKKYEKIDLSNYNFGDAANRILKENQGNLRNNAYDFFAMNDMWRKDPTRKMYVDIRGDFSIEQKAVINKAFDIIPDNLKTREFYYVKGAGVDDYLGPGKMQLPIDGNDEALKKLLYYYFGKSLFYDNKFKTIANDEMLGTAFREYMLHGENVKGLEKEIKEMMNVLDIRNKTPADYLTGPIPQFKRFLDLDDHEAAGMNRMWKIEDSNGDIWYIKSSSIVEEVMGEKVGFITAKELGIETYPEMRFVRTEDLDPALRITPKGREGYFIYTKEIPNVESLAYLGASPSRDILDTIATHEDDINKIFTMDILVKNSDRHYGNILLRQDIDNLAAIDHGLIFAYGTINQPFDHLMYGKLTRGEFDNWFEKALKPLIDKVDTNELLEEFRKAGLSSGELTEATRVVGGSKAYFKRDVLDFFERRGMFKPEKEVAQDFVQDVSFHGNHIPKYFREDMQKFYDNLPTDLQVPVTFREMKETGKVADNEVMVLRHLHKGDDLVNAGIEGYGYVLAKKYNLDADVFAKEFKDYVAGKKVKVHQNFLDEKFGKVKISKSKVVPPTPKPSAPSIATTPKLSFGDKLPKSFKEDISKWYDQLPTELKQEATFTRMGGKATSAPGEFKVPYNLKKDDLIRISIEDYAKELYPKIVKASDNIAEDQFIQGFRQYTRGEFVTYSNVNEFLTKKFKKDTPAPEPIKPPKIFDQTSVPLKVTDNTWVQSKNIDELQENIKNLDFEVHAQFKNDGTLLYLAKGDKSQVEYNPRMLNKGDADVMVHNHPSGVPFSATDIESHIKRIADDSLANPRDLLISKDKVLELDVTDIKKWNKNKKNFKADFRKVHTEHMKQVPGIARKESTSMDIEMDILSDPKYAAIAKPDGTLDFSKTKENMALFEQYKVDFKTLQDERVAEKRFEMLMPEINRLGERYGFKVVDYGNVSVTDAIKGVGVKKTKVPEPKPVKLDPANLQAKSVKVLKDDAGITGNVATKIELENGEIWYAKALGNNESLLERDGYSLAKKLGVPTYADSNIVEFKKADKELKKIMTKEYEKFYGLPIVEDVDVVRFTKEVPGAEDLMKYQDDIEFWRAHQDDIKKIYILDGIIGQQDGHLGNYVLGADNHIHHIDFGNAGGVGVENDMAKILFKEDWSKLDPKDFDKWFAKEFADYQSMVEQVPKLLKNWDTTFKNTYIKNAANFKNQVKADYETFREVNKIEVPTLKAPKPKKFNAKDYIDLESEGYNKDNIVKYVAANYNYKQLKGDINAVTEYVGSEYKAVNPHLRGEIKLDPKDAFDKDSIKVMKKLEKTLDKYELKDNLVLHRNMGEKFHLEGRKVGDIWNDPAFLSTTVDSDLADNFQWINKQDTWVAKIYAPKGTKGVFTDGFVDGKEGEFLLQKDTHFQILKIDKKNKRVALQAAKKEVEPPKPKKEVTDVIKGVGVPKKLVELDPFLKGQLNPGSLEHIERTLGKIPDTVKLDNKVIIKLDNNVPEDDIFRIDYKGDKDNIIIRLAGVDPEFVDQQIAMGYGAAFAIKNKIPDPEDFGSNFVSYLAKDYDVLSKPDKRDLDNIFKTGKHLEAPKAKPKSVSVPPKTKYITKDVDEFNIKEWSNLDRAESEYREALNDYKKMTKIDQEASIKYMDNFGKVNRTLWSGKETEMTKYLQENFDPVFEKYTLTENSVFWRKSDAKLFEKLKEGDIDSFKGYSSTTMVEDYMEDAYGHFSDRYSVRIIAPEGTEALQINNIGKLYGDELWKDNFEWEYLLKRDQQFQVLDIDKDSRTATIQLLVPEKKAVKEVSKDFVPEVRFIDKLKGEKLIQEGYDKLPDNLKYRIEVDGKADYLPEADIEQGIISVISESPKDLQLEEFYEGYGRILFNNDNFIRERYLLREGMEEVDMNPGDLLEFEENFARDFSDYLTRGTAEDPTFFKVLLKGELEEATKINLGEIDRTGYRVFEDETIPERLKALHNLTSKKLEDKLKTKQIDAIDEYKDPNLQTYKEINARLRGQLTDKDLDSESLKRIDDLTNEIQDAVTSYSLPEDTILHRVLGSNDKWADLEPGDVYTEKAFSSTSLRDETPIQKPWRAEILAPEGTKGLYVETIGIKLNEDEFLMPYGTSFQVLAVDPLENRIVFQVIPEKEKFTIAYYHDQGKIAEHFILEKGTTEEFEAFLDRAGDKKIYTIKEKDI